MWQALKMHYEKPTLHKEVMLLKKICTTRLLENANILEHLDKLEDYLDQLSVINSAMLSDRTCASLLLQSVPDSFGPLIMSITNQPDEKITLQLVKEKLLEEAERRTYNLKTETEAETAMKISRKDQSITIECYFCKSREHMKKQCRKNLI